MQVRVQHDIDDLANDLLGIAKKVKPEMKAVVREGIQTGNVVARDIARPLSGRHAKNYPKTFSSEMHGALSALTGGELISGEFGPAGGEQAFLPLERGNRNTKPQLALARAADLIGPSFGQEVAGRTERWFW